MSKIKIILSSFNSDPHKSCVLGYKLRLNL